LRVTLVIINKHKEKNCASRWAFNNNIATLLL